MASKLSKFRPRIVVVAVFIFLSVSLAEERSRCYWCGPLAEQVHRSQRAPSCDTFLREQHETLCERDYTHCALVAVSPPYAESRICVKLYQDECYSLYCNSTKTWRMVCACRGDLCNGPLTARETQAFALLPKFTKTKPRKRNIISHFISVKTRTPSEEDIVIIMSKENDTVHNIQSDQPMQANENTSNYYTPTPKRAEDNIIIVHGTLKNVVKIDHVSPSKLENNDESKMHGTVPTTTAEEEDKHFDSIKPDKQLSKSEVDKDLGNETVDKNYGNAELDKNLGNAEVEEHLDNPQVNKHVNNSNVDKIVNNSIVNKDLGKTESHKHDNAEMEKPLLKTKSAFENDKETHESTPVANKSIKPTVDIAVAVQSSATPGKMPPAESLQENFTPTKAMELTTMGTVAMNTENVITETTLPTEAKIPNKKNNGIKNLAHAHVTILVVSFLVYY